MRYLLLATLTVALSFGSMAPAAAQCPMCKISAESNLNNGGSAGQGLNKGILYLFATPYLIIGGLAFVWFRNRKLTTTEEQAEFN